MAKIFFDAAGYQMRSAGAWNTLLSFIRRNPNPSNHEILVKDTGKLFRLTEEEQLFMNHYSEHVTAFSISPDMGNVSAAARSRAIDLICLESIKAVVERRNGDPRRYEEISSSDFADLVQKFSSV